MKRSVSSEHEGVQLLSHQKVCVFLAVIFVEDFHVNGCVQKIVDGHPPQQPESFLGKT